MVITNGDKSPTYAHHKAFQKKVPSTDEQTRGGDIGCGVNDTPLPLR